MCDLGLNSGVEGKDRRFDKTANYISVSTRFGTSGRERCRRVVFDHTTLTPLKIATIIKQQDIQLLLPGHET